MKTENARMYSTLHTKKSIYRVNSRKLLECSMCVRRFCPFVTAALMFTFNVFNVTIHFVVWCVIRFSFGICLTKMNTELFNAWNFWLTSDIEFIIPFSDKTTITYRVYYKFVKKFWNSSVKFTSWNDWLSLRVISDLKFSVWMVGPFELFN